MWALLRLNPQSQDRYLEYMAERLPHIETYYPVYDRITRPAKKRSPITVRAPVYPGYIFVADGFEHQRALLSLPVRTWFVRLALDGQISRLPDWVIHGIRAMESRNELVRECRAESPYRRGMSVHVHLPVRTIRATIIRVAGSEVLVDTDWSLMRVRLGAVAPVCTE